MENGEVISVEIRGGKREELVRFPVEGGWIYRTTIEVLDLKDRATIATALLFVPGTRPA